MRFILNMIARGFGRGAMTLGRVQWELNGIAAIYVGVITLCVILAAHGMNRLSWVFLAAYTWAAYNIMPIVWAGFKALGVRYGEVWSQEKIRGAAKTLLVYGAVPFFYTGLMDMSGQVMENILLMIAIPTVATYASLKWPEGDLVFTTIGTVLILFVLSLVLTTLYNTFDRATTEPAVQVKQALLEKQAAATTKKRTVEIARIASKIENGVELDVYEWASWHTLGKDSATIAKAYAIAKKLAKKEPLEEKEEAFWRDLPNNPAIDNPVIHKVTEGGVKELVKHWPLLVGVIAAIILATLLMRKPRAVGTAGTASANTANGTSRSAWGKLWVFIGEVVLFLTVVWLVIYGIAVANDWNFNETGHIVIQSRVDTEVCINKKFPPGKQLEFVLPGKERGELNVEVMNTVVSERHSTDLAASLLIQKVERGQPFVAPATSSCLPVEWNIRSGKETPLKPSVHLNVVVRTYLPAYLPEWMVRIANQYIR